MLFGMTTWVFGKERAGQAGPQWWGSARVVLRAGVIIDFNVAGNLRNTLYDQKPNFVKEEILNHSGENTKPPGFLIQIWNPCFFAIIASV